MEFGISEIKDELMRSRYVEKQQISQTIKIICDPGKLDQSFHVVVNGPTQENEWPMIGRRNLLRSNRPVSEQIHMVNRGSSTAERRRTTEHVSMTHSEILSRSHDQGCVRQPGERIATTFLTDIRERLNYAVLGYIQRIQLLGCESGDVKGILIEWEEVREAEDCFQTMRGIQALTNLAQKLSVGKYHASHPSREKDEAET